MKFKIRQMKIDDYDHVCDLWENTEGLYLDESDSLEAISFYLKRNRGICFVAYEDDKIIGTVLCGHDGRRGILRHLAVDNEHRHKGIARELVNRSMSALAKAGIKRCTAFVLNENIEGLSFWQNIGWHVLEYNFRMLQSPTMQAE
jgi:N-acetylglutamate synthase